MAEPAPTNAAGQMSDLGDLGAPRDARQGGAFLRGPAAAYRPGYERPAGKFLQGINKMFSGLTSKMRKPGVRASDVDDDDIMNIISGKANLPYSPGMGMSKGQVGDINQAMLLQALAAMMKKVRR
jgi:hypothetical protein